MKSSHPSCLHIFLCKQLLKFSSEEAFSVDFHKQNCNLILIFFFCFFSCFVCKFSHINLLSDFMENLQKIRDENNFSFIISLISNMMSGLRHIWTMSSYYCSDENMLILLSKISNIFTIKVMTIIDLEKIFR
jgi:hypothetical protein